MPLLHRLIWKPQGIRDFLNRHPAVVLHADDVQVLRLQNCHSLLQIQLPVHLLHLPCFAGDFLVQLQGSAQVLPAVAADCQVPGNCRQKRCQIAFRAIEPLPACIKFHKSIIHAFLDILRILQVLLHHMPEQARVALHRQRHSLLRICLKQHHNFFL